MWQTKRNIFVIAIAKRFCVSETVGDTPASETTQSLSSLFATSFLAACIIKDPNQ
jgi:hypothetical protein